MTSRAKHRRFGSDPVLFPDVVQSHEPGHDVRRDGVWPLRRGLQASEEPFDDQVCSSEFLTSLARRVGKEIFEAPRKL